MKHQNTTYRYAQGGFGAISIDLVRDVIVKRSRKAGDTSIKNEALAYKLIQRQSSSSDHILQTVHVADDCIELERADCDLGFFTQNTKQPESFHLLVAVQSLEALVFVHQAGLVHCDIKPSNVLLCFDTEGNVLVKLCDFGLSHSINSTRTAVKGTSGYTDPRAVLQHKPLTPLSDIWSLGITLLMASGQYQHLDELGSKALKAACADKPLSAQQAEEYVQKALQKMPIPETAMGYVIQQLLRDHSADRSAKPADCYTQTLFSSLLSDLTQKYPQSIQGLAKASFDDSKLLRGVPFAEYFKFLGDEAYVYLMNRSLILTNGENVIAARDGFIYYSDPAFTQQHGGTFKMYLQRFGFKHEQLKTKSIPFIRITEVSQSDNEVIHFRADGLGYELDPSTGNQTVHLVTGRKAYSFSQNRFVI